MIWIEQCKAARRIEDEFGAPKALDYLVGEKFLNFLENAETNADLRADIPALVAEIKTIFATWQLKMGGKPTSAVVPLTCCSLSGRRGGCSRWVGRAGKIDRRLGPQGWRSPTSLRPRPRSCPYLRPRPPASHRG
jgi:hypothetical protein